MALYHRLISNRTSLATSYACVRLLEKEILALSKIERSKRNLILDPDFSLDDAFVSIDFKFKGEMTKTDIRLFLRNHDLPAFADDIAAIFARM